MKRFIILINLLFLIGIEAQIAHYNQYPSLYVDSYLDISQNTSFAYSMRLLSDSYSGPLIRLRRSSDNAQQDFYAHSQDRLSTSEISTWGGSSTLYVSIWYDQSNAGRNAVQTVNNFQPIFINDSDYPHFKCDGLSDYLRVSNGNIQNLVTNGKEGTILGYWVATKRNQSSFGVLNYSQRWSVHANWGNNNLYLDAGSCCDTNRFINNADRVNKWTQYSLAASSNTIKFRVNGVEKLNAPLNTVSNPDTTDFLIGAAANGLNNPSSHSTNSFMEFILYNYGLSDAELEMIEENEINFWGYEN